MAVPRSFVRLVDRVLDPLGFGLRRKPQIGFTPKYLSRIADPKTVIDVGVGDGTYPLYEAFPRAKFLLVEPVAEQHAAAQRIAEQYDATLIPMAVGSKPGELELQISGEQSTFLDLADPSELPADTPRRLIEVTTIDRIVANHADLEDPILLKVDTEGYELEALRGATETLKRVDTVIAEVNMRPRYEGGYAFEEVGAFLRDHGFTTFSILTAGASPGRLQQTFCDVVFKRR